MLEFIVLGHVPFTSIYLPFGATIVLIGLVLVGVIAALYFLSLQPLEDSKENLSEKAI